ncbi:MAG TPA: hypothetical protein VM238_05665 [Phycisphaerae bacterium]|nr:hypothetical protein [Phycisphaerae bacterium]
MADSTLDASFLIMFDQWPGVARVVDYADMPAAFLTPVATAVFRQGEKICVRNPLTSTAVASATTALGLNGWTTFVYLQLGTQGTTIVAGDLVVPCLATNPFVVSNDQTGGATPALDALGSPLAAIALSAVTNGYWAWFFCGGVSPVWHAVAVGGNMITGTADVEIGLVCADTADTGTNETVLGAVAADTSAPIGYTLAADAA